MRSPRRSRPPGAQIELAWLLAQRPWISPIPGTTKIPRLEENVAAASVELTDVDRARLTEVSDLIDTTADRYPEKMQKMIDR
jgi:aryl-alcohol dehydrogenase-like predicted oxidoreductase